MTITIDGYCVESLAIVDDNETQRETLRDELVMEGFTVDSFAGPFDSTEDLVNKVRNTQKAAVFDHHLVNNYARTTGAEAVAKLYDHRVPAVLVTNWSNADELFVRRFRRNIPLLVKTEDVSGELIQQGIRLCLQEFKGLFSTRRKPYRTAIKVEEIRADENPSTICALIPGWDPREVVQIPMDLIPSKIGCDLKPGDHLFAMVNKGAESAHELYFTEFEKR